MTSGVSYDRIDDAGLHSTQLPKPPLGKILRAQLRTAG